MKFVVTALAALAVAASAAPTITLTGPPTNDIYRSKVGEKLRLDFDVTFTPEETGESVSKASISIPMTKIPSDFKPVLTCTTKVKANDADDAPIEDIVGTFSSTATSAGFPLVSLSSVFGETPVASMKKVTLVSFECSTTAFTKPFSATSGNAIITYSVPAAAEEDEPIVQATKSFSLIVTDATVREFFEEVTLTALHNAITPQTFSLTATNSAVSFNRVDIHLTTGQFAAVNSNPTCSVAFNNQEAVVTPVTLDSSNSILSFNYTPAKPVSSTFTVYCDHNVLGVVSGGLTTEDSTGIIAGSVKTSTDINSFATVIKADNADPSSAFSPSVFGTVLALAVTLALLF